MTSVPLQVQAYLFWFLFKLGFGVIVLQEKSWKDT